MRRIARWDFLISLFLIPESLFIVYILICFILLIYFSYGIKIFEAYMIAVGVVLLGERLVFGAFIVIDSYGLFEWTSWLS